MAILFACGYSALVGLWLGLLPYMLLRYRNCDLLGNGKYLKGQ